jgi:hypothetical protein
MPRAATMELHSMVLAGAALRSVSNSASNWPRSGVPGRATIQG